MPHFFCSRLLPVILCLALFSATEASAQLDEPSLIQEVDPDTDPDDSEDSVYEDEAPVRPGKKKPRGKEPAEDEPKALPTKPTPPASPAAPTATPPTAPPAPSSRPPPPPLLAPRVSDADLLAVWDRWKQARAAGDVAAAEQGRKGMLKLRDEVSASDFDAFSVSLLREARTKREAGDLNSAVQLAEAAAALSPNLPYARFSSSPASPDRRR
jgi:hypothetical protein